MPSNAAKRHSWYGFFSLKNRSEENTAKKKHSGKTVILRTTQDNKEIKINLPNFTGSLVDLSKSQRRLSMFSLKHKNGSQLSLASGEDRPKISYPIQIEGSPHYPGEHQVRKMKSLPMREEALREQEERERKKKAKEAETSDSMSSLGTPPRSQTPKFTASPQSIITPPRNVFERRGTLDPSVSPSADSISPLVSPVLHHISPPPPSESPGSSLGDLRPRNQRISSLESSGTVSSSVYGSPLRSNTFVSRATSRKANPYALKRDKTLIERRRPPPALTQAELAHKKYRPFPTLPETAPHSAESLLAELDYEIDSLQGIRKDHQATAAHGGHVESNLYEENETEKEASTKEALESAPISGNLARDSMAESSNPQHPLDPQSPLRDSMLEVPEPSSALSMSKSTSSDVQDFLGSVDGMSSIGKDFGEGFDDEFDKQYSEQSSLHNLSKKHRQVADLDDQLPQEVVSATNRPAPIQNVSRGDLNTPSASTLHELTNPATTTPPVAPIRFSGFEYSPPKLHREDEADRKGKEPSITSASTDYYDVSQSASSLTHSPPTLLKNTVPSHLGSEALLYPSSDVSSADLDDVSRTGNVSDMGYGDETPMEPVFPSQSAVPITPVEQMGPKVLIPPSYQSDLSAPSGSHLLPTPGKEKHSLEIPHSDSSQSLILPSPLPNSSTEDEDDHEGLSFVARTASEVEAEKPHKMVVVNPESSATSTEESTPQTTPTESKRRVPSGVPSGVPSVAPTAHSRPTSTVPTSYDRRENPVVRPLAHSSVVAAVSDKPGAAGAKRLPPDYSVDGRGRRSVSISTANPGLFDTPATKERIEEANRAATAADVIAPSATMPPADIIPGKENVVPPPDKGVKSLYIERLRAGGKSGYTAQEPSYKVLPIAVRPAKRLHKRTPSHQATVVSMQSSLKHGTLRPKTRLIASEIDDSELPNSMLSHDLAKTKVPTDPDAEIIEVTNQLKKLTEDPAQIRRDAQNAGLSRLSSVRSARGMALGGQRMRLFVANPDNDSE